MKNRLPFLMMAAVATVSTLALTGCGGLSNPFKNSNIGPTPLEQCFAKAQQRNAAKNVALSQLNMGQNFATVKKFLGAPPMREDWLLLKDGRRVHVAFFELEHAVCMGRKVDDQTVFMPTVFQSDTLIGFGAEFYNLMIRPIVAEQEAAPKKKAQKKSAKKVGTQAAAGGAQASNMGSGMGGYPQFIMAPYPVYYPMPMMGAQAPYAPYGSPYMPYGGVPQQGGFGGMAPMPTTTIPGESGSTIIIPLDE